MLKATLAILKLKLYLFANKSFDGFQNNFKFIALLYLGLKAKL